MLRLFCGGGGARDTGLCRGLQRCLRQLQANVEATRASYHKVGISRLDVYPPEQAAISMAHPPRHIPSRASPGGYSKENERNANQAACRINVTRTKLSHEERASPQTWQDVELSTRSSTCGLQPRTDVDFMSRNPAALRHARRAMHMGFRVITFYEACRYTNTLDNKHCRTTHQRGSI